MSVARRLASTAVSAVVVLAIAGLSRLPWTDADRDGALVRLSWRLAGVTIEECRTLSPEELDALPAHMRRPEVCTGSTAAYALTVDVDGRRLLGDTVRGAGARRDRPLYVLYDVPVAPGAHDVRVGFEAILPPGVEPEDRPLSFGWADRVELESGQIALITLDDAGTRLLRAVGAAGGQGGLPGAGLR